ncbi:MAG TPA: CPBP family intramembrane glutamic endopeptidase [Bacteroidales bacterium]|nr:CPBP family intramembrane glutamic endopeptidase [Bacteroidales bacterium]
MTIFLQSLRQGFQGMSVPVKILVLTFLVVLFLLLSSVFATLLAIPLFNISIVEIYGIISNPSADNIAIVKFFQISQSVFLFIVPAILAAWLFGKNTFGYLGAQVKPRISTLLLVTGSVVIAIPFLNAVTSLNTRLDLPGWMDGLEREIRALEESAARLTGLFLESRSGRDLAVNMLMIAILPAIGEEFLFRGVLQRLLTDWTKNRHMGVILGAFIFSFIHLQFYGFVPRFLLGLYFGYLFLWSSSIWVPVAGHFINNGLAVAYYHFAADPIGETALDRIGTSAGSSYPFVISMIFTALLLVLIYRNEKNAGMQSS